MGPQLKSGGTLELYLILFNVGPIRQICLSLADIITADTRVDMSAGQIQELAAYKGLPSPVYP